MNDKNNIISLIQDLLGSEASPELAEAVYTIARDAGQIYWASDYEGVVMSPDIDIVALAAEALNEATGLAGV